MQAELIRYQTRVQDLECVLSQQGQVGQNTSTYALYTVKKRKKSVLV